MNLLKFVVRLIMAAICLGLITFVAIELQAFVNEAQHTIDTATSVFSNLPVR